MEPAAVKKARISDEDVPLLAEYRDFMRDILAAADVIDDCVRRLHEEVSAACAGAMAATVSVQTSLTSLSLGAKEALRTTSASNSKKLEYHMEELDAVDKAAMAASRLATGLIGSQEVNDPVLLAALEAAVALVSASGVCSARVSTLLSTPSHQDVITAIYSSCRVSHGLQCHTMLAPKWYKPGVGLHIGPHDNIISIQLIDCDGNPLSRLRAEDIVFSAPAGVVVTVTRADDSVIGTLLVNPTVVGSIPITVTPVIAHQQLPPVTILPAPTVASATPVSMLPLSTESGHRGLSVSPDGSTLAILRSARACSTVFMYSVDSLALIRTVSDDDDDDEDALELQSPVDLAFSYNGNILILEKGASRIQEVTVYGKSVRTILDGSASLDSIDANADHIVTITLYLMNGPALSVYHAQSGARLRHIQPLVASPAMNACYDIKLTPDGQHVVIAGDNGLTLFTLPGNPFGFTFTPSGDFAALYWDESRVRIFSSDGSRQLLCIGAPLLSVLGDAMGSSEVELEEDDAAPGRFMYPTAVTWSPVGLLVLDDRNGRVQVFK